MATELGQRADDVAPKEAKPEQASRGDYYRRLKKAVAWSRKEMEHYRTNRLVLLRQFVGKHFGPNGAPDKVPVNFLAMAMTIYLRTLAARAPTPLVTTKAQQLKGRTKQFEGALKEVVRETCLQRTIRAACTNAMFYVGIAKIGLDMNNEVEIEGDTHHYGKPFCDHISLDDFVIDMTAKSWHEAHYMGNYYRVSLEDARRNPLFDEKAREALTKTELTGKNDDQSGSDERAEMIGKDKADFADAECQDMVDLVDIYSVTKNRMMTFPVKGDWTEETCLYDQEWYGPEEGPYYELSFMEVPDNIFPIGPAPHWQDLQDASNRIYNKLIRQADRQKVNTVYQGAAAKDAQRVKDARDGEMIQVNDVKSIAEISFGGPDQRNFGLFQDMRGLLNQLAGNVESLGGLGTVANTLGQEEMIAGTANKQVAEMVDRVTDFTARVMRALGWYEWNDPITERVLTMPFPGTSVEVEVPWTPEDRTGEFYHMNVTIDPYSMRHETPASKLMGLKDFLQTIMGLVPFMQAQGVGMNVENFTRLYGQYAGLTDLNDLLVAQEPPQEHLDESGPSTPKPNNTTRTYKRVNMPGANVDGKRQAMISQAMGMNQQGHEAAQIGRSTA